MLLPRTFLDNLLSQVPKRTKQPKSQDRLNIEQDPTIIRYFNNIKSRARNKGFLSEDTERLTIYSVILFLKYLQKPITKTAMLNLINSKKANMQNFDIDDKLEFSNLKPLTTHRNRATYIKGIFKANHAPL